MGGAIVDVIGAAKGDFDALLFEEGNDAIDFPIDKLDIEHGGIGCVVALDQDFEFGDAADNGNDGRAQVSKLLRHVIGEEVFIVADNDAEGIDG